MNEEFSRVVSGSIQLKFLDNFLNRGDSLYVNPQSGFLTSERKMTVSEVADYWSTTIFPDNSAESYSASFPFARGRLLYVIETIIQTLGLGNRGKTKWCDFATGEGVLLDYLNSLYPQISTSGTEHSQILVSKLREKGFDVVQAALGLDQLKLPSSEYDVSTLTWTLANSIDPLKLLEEVVFYTKKNGFVCVAESSRILVPPKKSLHDYLSKQDPADSHPSHFSANTLRCIMELVGLEVVYTNRYFDSDVLLVIGKKCKNPRIRGYRDSQDKVVQFMKYWATQTQFYETLRD